MKNKEIDRKLAEVIDSLVDLKECLINKAKKQDGVHYIGDKYVNNDGDVYMLVLILTSSETQGLCLINLHNGKQWDVLEKVAIYTDSNDFTFVHEKDFKRVCGGFSFKRVVL